MKQLKKNNDLVVSSNDLVNAKYDLTLWQKRVFIYAISKLNKDDKNFKPIRMEITDIIRFFKSNDSATTYKAIAETPTTLDKRIEIPYTTKEGGRRYGYIRLLQKYTIPADDKKSNQYIELRFNDDLKPHLLELKDKFSKYDIANIIDMQSVYSFRMFEILKSYEFRKSIELDVDVLKEMLEVAKKYKNYTDFRINVIEKAQEDLTKFCDITFSFEERKGVKGKKIESLLFHIRKNTPTHREQETAKEFNNKYSNVELAEVISEVKTKKTPIIPPISTIFTNETSENSPKDKLIEELFPIIVSQFGVSFKMFNTLIEQHTEGVIRQAILVTQKAMQARKIDNTAGFFVEAVRGHYQNLEEDKQKMEAEKMAKKKAKMEQANQVEQTAQQQKEQAVKNESQRKIKIIEGLINADSPLLHQAIADLKRGPLGVGLDPKISIQSFLENPMLAGKLMTVLQKIAPTIFQ